MGARDAPVTNRPPPAAVGGSVTQPNPLRRTRPMCCFSQPVDYVAGTNIFARPAKGGGQYLVYSMSLKAGTDLAMILPIPTPKASKEDAVTFINLEKYPDFFDDMRSGFPVPVPPSRTKDA